MDKSELKKYSEQLDYNLGQIELDYYQHFILGKLFNKFNSIYFKGGTCLQKCYGIKRFSDDLDFNFTQTDINEIIGFIENCFDSKISNYFETKFGYSFDVKFNGFLFNGSLRSQCKISFDFRLNDFYKNPIKKIIRPIYGDLPDYFILAMSVEEIFSEKIRAIITRYKARDIFDLNELILKGVNCDLDLINKKLKSYNLKFDFVDFEKKLLEKKNIFDDEMKRLIKIYPNFDECKINILEKMREFS